WADDDAVLRESVSDEYGAEWLLETDESLSYRRAGLGTDVVRKLRRGHWTVSAQLDLHGLRVDEAREAVAEFLRECVRQERRCVRIIHGKGLGSANRTPVLKEKVRRWLTQKDEVLAFVEARPDDGGSGVVLALLKGTGCSAAAAAQRPPPGRGTQTAAPPVSPVRMRMTGSMVETKILPSPILPVGAALMMASQACSTRPSGSTTSMRILGRKSTTYSAPR